MSHSASAQALQITLAHLQGALTYTEQSNIGEEQTHTIEQESGRQESKGSTRAACCDLTDWRSPDSDTNKKLWNTYAANYKEQHQTAATKESSTSAPTASADAAAPSAWVLDMASHVQRDAAQLEFLGDECTLMANKQRASERAGA